MTSLTGRASRVLFTALALVACSAGAARAALTPVPHTATGADQLAAAIRSTSAPGGSASFVTVPPNGNPDVVADSSLAGFPTDGGTYAILTSGDGTLAGNAQSSFAGPSDGGAAYRGPANDVSLLAVPVTVPSTANCLSIDFRFASEEYPNFVGGSVNDAFIAELDTDDWTVANGGAVTAPHDFAFDSQHNAITINTAAGLSSANAAGTVYGGATDLLAATTPITPGNHTVYLSVFDGGDDIYDSAAFLDNLRVGFVPNPSVNCGGAVAPINETLDLDPQTGSSAKGTDHTVTATLKSQSGTPVADAPIAFTVTGANSASGTANTGSDGTAQFTYTGTNAGNDGISACAQPDSDNACAANASATWQFTAPVNHTLTVGDATVTEGGQADIPVALDSASTQNVSFEYSTSDGSASSGSDYTATSGTVTIPAGSTTGHILVNTTDDAVVEGPETVSVGISNLSGATATKSTGTLTIDDNDNASISVGSKTVTEGATGEVPITLSAPAERDVHVTYATGTGSATAGDDYTAVSDTATIAAGNTAVDVPIDTADDDIVEGDETVPVSASADGGTTVSGAGLTIDDNDTASISVGHAEVTEGATGSVPITLSAPAERRVIISYATADGSATDGEDYTAVTGTATLSPGDTEADVPIDTTDDAIVEGSETVTVSANADGGEPTSGAGLTIDDNDEASVTVGDNTVTEGATGAVPITLSAPAERDVTVSYATGDGTATSGDDYTPESGTTTITAGQTEADVAIQTTDDAIVEGAEFVPVTASADSGPPRAFAALRTFQFSGGLTITDNDAASLSVGSGTVTEGDTGSVPVTLSAPAEREVQVSYSTGSGSATAGDDYTAVLDTATIAAGDTVVDVPITTTDDDVVEGDETVPVSAAADGGDTVTGDGLTIHDNDVASLTVGSDSVTEGDTGSVPVTLTAPAERDVQVSYSTGDGSATPDDDYTAVSDTATIAAGDTTVDVPIPTTDDDIVEGDETVPVSASADGGETVSGDGLAITDNDAAALTVGSDEVTEGDTGSVAVTLSAPAQRDVLVAYSTGTGTATAGDDYTAVSDTATIAAGDTEVSVPIATNDDAIVEASETVPVSAAADGGDTATGDGLTIDDDDSAVVSIADGTTPESNDGKLTVSLAAAAERPVQVLYRTGQGTATPASDYTRVDPGSVTVPAGQTSADITIGVLEDNVSEPAETVPVDLIAERAPANGAATVTNTIDDGHAVLTITDDDAESISIGDATVSGGETGELAVTLAHPADHVVTVDYASEVSPSGAATPVSGTLTFAPGDTTQNVQIPTHAFAGPPQVFSVDLSNGSATIADGHGNLTIQPVRGAGGGSGGTNPTPTPTPTPTPKPTATATATHGGGGGGNATDATIANVRVHEGNHGKKRLTLTITGSPQSVTYETSDGTAKQGKDYVKASGTAVIAAGQDSTTITIKIIGDHKHEHREAFFVTLGNGQVARVGIIDNDPRHHKRKHKHKQHA